MKQILRLIVLFFAVAMSLQAMPPRRQFPIIRQQPDGTRITLIRYAQGDMVVYATQDGKAVCRAADGSYRYAVSVDDGIAASGQLAHEVSQRTEAERTYVSMQAISFKDLISTSSVRRAPTMKSAALNADGLGTYGSSARGSVNSIGVHSIPVLMVEFKDVSFQDFTTQEKIQRQLTEQGYHDEDLSKSSARDYFLDQSLGMFDPQFEVLGCVKVSKERAYYGQNYGTSHNRYISQFVKEAMDSAVAHGIDLSPYVESGKGGVPLVSIIYAGRGEATSYETGCEDYIWPHFATLTYKPKGTSYNIKSYFVGNELMCEYKGVFDDEGNLIDILAIEGTDHMMGIGIFVHEFGHALGLPDFYCTDYNHTEPGMGGLSIMDYGGYLYDTYCPLGYDAYERNFMGWLQLTELTEPGSYELYPFGDERGQTAYIIRNNDNNKEYFILENRQPTYFFPSMMGKGLFVVHCDYDASEWTRGTLNNDKDHLRMTYIPADNNKEYDYNVAWSQYKGSFYPYSKNGLVNDSLTQNSVPNDAVFIGEHMNKPIYNIALSDEGVISFDFIEKPEPTGIHDVTLEPKRKDILFDLQGRRVSKAQRGVYILNGRKVLR